MLALIFEAVLLGFKVLLVMSFQAPPSSGSGTCNWGQALSPQWEFRATVRAGDRIQDKRPRRTVPSRVTQPQDKIVNLVFSPNICQNSLSSNSRALCSALEFKGFLIRFLGVLEVAVPGVEVE